MKVGVESNNILTNMTYIQECATCQIKNTSDIVYKKHVTLKPPKKKRKDLDEASTQNCLPQFAILRCFQVLYNWPLADFFIC